MGNPLQPSGPSTEGLAAFGSFCCEGAPEWPQVFSFVVVQVDTEGLPRTLKVKQRCKHGAPQSSVFDNWILFRKGWLEPRIDLVRIQIAGWT